MANKSEKMYDTWYQYLLEHLITKYSWRTYTIKPLYFMALRLQRKRGMYDSSKKELYEKGTMFYFLFGRLV